MGRTKRFWVPYAPYDIEGHKWWLDEKSREGYRLVKMKPYFAVFEETDREELMYHLEPAVKDWKKPMDDILESRGIRGWTYAGTLSNEFHVFHAPPGTSDFHADKEAFKGKLEDKLKDARWKFIWSIPLLLLVVVTQPGIDRLIRNPRLWMIEEFNYFHIAYLILLLSGVMTKLLTYRRHRKFVIQMEHKDEREDYVPSSGLYRLIEVIGTGVLISVIILSLTFMFTGNHFEGYADEQDMEKYPTVSLKHMESAENQEIFDSESVNYNSFVFTYESIFIEEKISMNQYVSRGLYGQRSISEMSVIYYDTISPYFAEIIQSEAEKKVSSIISSAGIKSEMHGVEITMYKSRHSQFLLLRHSDLFLEVEYSGDADLTEWTEEFAVKLITYGKSKQQ